METLMKTWLGVVAMGLSANVMAAPDAMMGNQVLDDGTPAAEGKSIYIEATIVPWVEVQERNGVVSVTPPRHGVQVGGDSAAGLLVKKQPTDIGDASNAGASPNYRLDY